MNVSEHMDLIAAIAIAVAFLLALALTWRVSTRDGDEITRLRDDLRDERARSQYLMNIVLDMRVSGGVVDRLARMPSAAGAAVDRLPQKVRSDIDQAIDENKHASSNPRLRSHLSHWAAMELEKPKADRARILDRLRGWSIIAADDDDDDDEEDDAVIAV